jgi:hypothetical protein
MGVEGEMVEGEIEETDAGVHVNPAGQLVVVGADVGVVVYVEVLPVVKVISLAGAVLPEAVESILK